VNPARSIATAVFQGDWALGQVWAFIAFPVIGALVAGAIWVVVGPQSTAVATPPSDTMIGGPSLGPAALVRPTMSSRCC